MTQPPVWFKQKDPARPEAPPVWATRIIPYHVPVGRSLERPDTLPDYNPSERILS